MPKDHKKQKRLLAELQIDDVVYRPFVGKSLSTTNSSPNRPIRRKTGQLSPSTQSQHADIIPASPGLAARTSPSPAKRKQDSVSRSSSSLSEASQVPSPTAAAPPPDRGPARISPASSASSDDAHQPPPAASITQYPTFGPNPLTFDDPTCYEILPVQDDMTDEEKREIYCVSTFPHDDLHDLIAGTPPNKDFSNAVKPSNQVSAHTFNAYLENYLRPLKEEDIGFLQERVSFGELTP